jgi:hypothetical protein
MSLFIGGALAMGYWVAGLIFLRSWVRTRDRLLAAFAIAFWMLALVRISLMLTHETVEHKPYIYGFRLMAYVIILLAIVDKNRPARQTSSAS